MSYNAFKKITFQWLGIRPNQVHIPRPSRVETDLRSYLQAASRPADALWFFNQPFQLKTTDLRGGWVRTNGRTHTALIHYHFGRRMGALLLLLSQGRSELNQPSCCRHNCSSPEERTWERQKKRKKRKPEPVVWPSGPNNPPAHLFSTFSQRPPLSPLSLSSHSDIHFI